MAIKNPMVNTQFTKFIESEGLDGHSEDVLFELFSIYVIEQGKLSRNLEYSDIHFSGSEFGIDGAAVIVNSELITDTSQLAEVSPLRNVEFHFFQSKSGEKSKSGDVGNFFTAVKDFFDDDFESDSEDLNSLHSVKEFIYKKITEQVALLETTRETRLATLATVTARRDTLQGRLDATNPTYTDRIADLTARIARDDGRIAELNANIDSLDERLAYYAGRTDYLSGRVSALTVRADRLAQACEPANDNMAPQSATLYYLHTDHLGRPKVATDTDGAVVWDGGLTTPFGQGVSTMGAITQKLMFPGQYQDEETGYAHNWHRTYDPTLGRYLQADPIGLAGGLNRYAYVGGNPVSYVDPRGLRWVYSQGTGKLSYEDESDNCQCTPTSEAPELTEFPQLQSYPNEVAEGYAGAPRHVNNPASERLSNLGVLPVGLYDIGPQSRSRRTGRHLPLSPHSSNNMYGRFAFQIHGDNSSLNQSASNGCIILPRNIRDIINNSNDKLLEVRR